MSDDLVLGLAARNAAIREGANAVASWKDHSNKLQQKLNNAVTSEMNLAVEREVCIEYIQQLRKALIELAPNHPLINKQNSDKILNEARRKGFAARGYDFDVSTGNYKKR